MAAIIPKKSLIGASQTFYLTITLLLQQVSNIDVIATTGFINLSVGIIFFWIESNKED